eukprot:scaffold95101_cov46-Cyclotella_meneghiniana.AAC.2
MSMTYIENARGFADHNRRDYAALTSTYFDGDDYAPLTSMCFDRAALTSTYFDGDDYAPLTSRGFDRDASMIMELSLARRRVPCLVASPTPLTRVPNITSTSAVPCPQVAMSPTRSHTTFHLAIINIIKIKRQSIFTLTINTNIKQTATDESTSLTRLSLGGGRSRNNGSMMHRNATTVEL